SVEKLGPEPSESEFTAGALASVEKLGSGEGWSPGLGGTGRAANHLFDADVRQIEVGRVVDAVVGPLPAAGDPPSAVLEPAGEPLRERGALAPQLPLGVVDAHPVDTAHAAIIRVQLVIGAIAGVAAHDRKGLRGVRVVGGSPLHEMSARRV